MSPISASLNPRLWAKRGKVGDFDMVELRIAKKPERDSARKPLENLALSVKPLQLCKNSTIKIDSPHYLIQQFTKLR